MKFYSFKDQKCLEVQNTSKLNIWEDLSGQSTRAVNCTVRNGTERNGTERNTGLAELRMICRIRTAREGRQVPPLGLISTGRKESQRVERTILKLGGHETSKPPKSRFTTQTSLCSQQRFSCASGSVRRRR